MPPPPPQGFYYYFLDVDVRNCYVDAKLFQDFVAFLRSLVRRIE